jgi:hypothetical protein
MPLGRKIGIDQLCGHSLRALSITKMISNDVPLPEVLATARHKSVSASLTYQSKTTQGRNKKYKAFGINTSI